MFRLIVKKKLKIKIIEHTNILDILVHIQLIRSIKDGKSIQSNNYVEWDGVG